MKVLFASAEVDPFSKVGGLADVASALPSRLAELGHDVRIVTPCHASGLPAFHASAEVREMLIRMPGRDRPVRVARVKGEGDVPADLVLDDHYFGRQHVYGEPDDLLRYQFFCRVVVELLKDTSWTPDILHLNDWHTAPLAFAVRNLAWSNPILRGVATVFTIHNLRYRGPDDLNDFLAQAIYYSDVVTTVSPSYALEIVTREYGEGLDELLALRGENLRGILNGLNYDLYNPRTDPYIHRQFDLTSLEERAANRAALREAVDLPERPGPLTSMVTRLTEQKGIDLVLQAVPEIVAVEGQLVVLGQGDEPIVNELRRLEREFPGGVRLAERFDEGLARQIYAGADILLMPSRYEPCGLGQLLAMRYGSVPLGRRTGGLGDTIIDPEEQPDAATGFLFDEFTSFALVGAFERATRAFRQPEVWTRLQENGMSRDYSWKASAAHYIETYVAALRARGILPLDF